MDLSPGVRLGIYQIESLLGVGGMGEVYRARDTRLGRDVAVKILPRAFTSDADRLSRFEREARVLATLNHPNIAAIYGVVESGDVRALVLELVEGQTLAERIGRPAAPMPIGDALSVAMQIVEALDVAHAKGIVHRDLKPANIKITPDGVVKVLDFGLAKQAISYADPDSPTITQHDTRAGRVFGTPSYMSPEQARGQAVDKRADIWAFGCVLFEMLAGRAPFQGQTASDIVAAILDREPAWDALPASVPPPTRRLLERALDKNVRRRLRDIGDARVDIDPARSDRGRSELVTRSPAGGRWRIWLVASAGLVVLGLGAATALWERRPAPAILPETRLEISTPPTAEEASIAISPNGFMVAFVAESEGHSGLWLRALNSVSARPLSGTGGAVYPFWSPDSRSIGFFADRKLKRIDIDGGAARTLMDTPNPLGGAWSGDGTIVLTPNQISPLVRLSIDGATAAVTQLAPGQVGHLFPQLLPDGIHVLYVATGAPDTRGVYLGRLDGTASRKLVDLSSSSAVYASTGHVLFARESALFAQELDAAQMRLKGSPVAVADGVAVERNSSPAGVLAVSASSAGPIVFRGASTGGARQMTWFDRAGRALTRIGTPDSARSGSLSLSPNGRRVALTRTVDGNADVWLLDLARSGLLSRFTFDPSTDSLPLWSRDGQRIAFSSTRTGPLNMYLKALDSDGDGESLRASAQNNAVAEWSPDGAVLLYARADPKTGLDIWALPMGAEAEPFPVVQSTAPELNPQFAPNGAWIAYQSNESRQWEVYVRALRDLGGALPVSVSGGTQPRWRSDGKELFYLGLDGRLMAVPVTFSPTGRSVEAGVPIPLFATRIGGPGIAQREYEVSPDGQRFLIDDPIEGTSAPIILIQNWRPPS